MVYWVHLSSTTFPKHRLMIISSDTSVHFRSFLCSWFPPSSVSSSYSFICPRREEERWAEFERDDLWSLISQVHDVVDELMARHNKDGGQNKVRIRLHLFCEAVQITFKSLWWSRQITVIRSFRVATFPLPFWVLRVSHRLDQLTRKRRKPKHELQHNSPQLLNIIRSSP